MQIAALVLGIVSLVIAVFPFCGYIAIIPAIVGLVLGIVDLVKRVKEDKEAKEKTKKAMTITGIALSGAAIAILSIWTFLFFIIGISDYGYNYDSYFDYNDFTHSLTRYYDI